MDRAIMAIGNTEIEEYINESTDISVESVGDIDMIKDILEYDRYEFVIINTLLSTRKSVQLADFVENMDSQNKPKIIALIDTDEADKKFITQMVGFGVYAFVPFDDLNMIKQYIVHYPERYILSAIDEGKVKDTIQEFKAVNGTITIGVFGLDNGTGTTTCAFKIAAEIANGGYRTVLLEIGTDNFKYLKKTPKSLEIVSADDEEKDSILQLAFSDNSYQFIVIDFGKMFNVSHNGENLSLNQERIGDFMRCNYRIGTCFASAWHNRKMKFFLKEPSFQMDIQNEQLYLVVSGDEKAQEEMIEDYHELEIFKRDNIDEFISKLQQRIGIDFVKKKEKARKGIFRRFKR
ncbi:MAG: hypothetical protein ACI4LO_08000 [Anaerovoracaceae bacterium]